MTKLLKLNVIVILVMILSYNAQSIGLGFYVPFSSGTSTNEISDGGPNWNASHSGAGFGFVMDTKLAGDKLFNYRLNIGFHYSSSLADNPDYIAILPDSYYNYGYDVSNYSLVFDNTFGFGFLRTPALRLWAGPQLRFGYTFGTGDANCKYCNYTDKLEITDYQVGLGFAPVLGANFNLGNVVSLCADMGYRWTIGYGGCNYDYYDNSFASNNDAGVFSEVSEYFVNISLIFRINDNFKSYGSRTKKRR